MMDNTENFRRVDAVTEEKAKSVQSIASLCEDSTKENANVQEAAKEGSVAVFQVVGAIGEIEASSLEVQEKMDELEMEEEIKKLMMPGGRIYEQREYIYQKLYAILSQLKKACGELADFMSYYQQK